jgi:hypothetical protein
MDDTGIGFAGIEGAWWLPAVDPFTLPAELATQLTSIGRAIFTLFDVLTGDLAHEPEIARLLSYKIPEQFVRDFRPMPVHMVRPDFQLVEQGGDYHLVATELEFCPAALGFAHAMQVGYGLQTDLVDWFVDFLRGRSLVIAGTAQWSEFLFEQLAFCQALAERGANGYVMYDRPITTITAEVAGGCRWLPPLFGVPYQPDNWKTDVAERLRKRHWEPYIWSGNDWPDTISDAVIFRFGYLDCFEPTFINKFAAWHAKGATYLNPPGYFLEIKTLLAVARLPIVREKLNMVDPSLEQILGKCLPETRLLTPSEIPSLLHERVKWIIKYAGFDGRNQAWGGRSLMFGSDHSDESWSQVLHEAAGLPWPVVAQRLTPSARIDIDYYGASNERHSLKAGVTRLLSFLLRDETGIVSAAGTHMTVSASRQVSESIESVQAPVQFLGR